MSGTKKQNSDPDRPPKWLIDELERDPELLRIVAALVKTLRARHSRKNPRR